MSRLGKRRLNCASEEEGTAAAVVQQRRREEQQPMGMGPIGNNNVFVDSQPIGAYFPAYLPTCCPPFDPEYSSMDNGGHAYLLQQPFAITSSSSSSSSCYNQSVNYYPPAIPCQEAMNAGIFPQCQLAQHVTPKDEKTESNNGQQKGAEAQMMPMNTANVCHQMSLFLQSRSPFETFCTVPGRTSLLSSTTKYKVTVGEIQRRINPPECLNASLIGGILRKAKSKDGGKALRESLKRIGLSLPAGRRKSACVTAFTALVEEEAVHLANDFHVVLQREFPVKDAALYLNSQFLHFSGHPMDIGELVNRRKSALNCARLFLKELSDLVGADRSPICERRPELVLEPNIQKPLTHFSLITHGFGGIAILAVLELMNICIGESLKNLDKMSGQLAFEESASAAGEMSLHGNM